MNSCWAACLGNCGGKRSREHLVSHSLFTGSTVEVQGFSWCQDRPVEVGLTGLTAKVLCETHNNLLSSLDECAGKAFETLREMARLYDVRRKLKPRHWSVKTYRVDGQMLERWFLKTLINIALRHELPIGSDAEPAGRISERLVRIAYGLEPFGNSAGLYSIVREGMTLDMEDRVTFSPLVSSLQRITGGLFTFRGLTFLLNLDDGGPPKQLTGLIFNGEHLADTQLIYHPVAIRMNVEKYLSHKFKFSW